MFDFSNFAGDVKVGWSIFGKLETKAIKYFTPKIPKCIEGYHLTLSSIIWCVLIIFFSYLSANYSIHWMWATSLMILAQYVTDSLDGSLGRFRNTGIPKWGYYMDHFLDYIFLCSILIGYSFLFNDKFNTLFFILAIFGAFMVNSYLYFSVTNKFKIEYLGIGPTEIRFIFILINTLLIFFHKTYMVKFLPAVLLFSLVGLIYVVYRSQKEIWKIDMSEKQKLTQPTIDN